MEVIQLNSLEELESLEEEWNNLLKNSETNTIFQTFEFLTSWFKFLGKNRKIMVLVIKEEGKLIGIAPFMVSKERVLLFNIRKIEFLGVLNADYCDFIIGGKKEEVIKEIYNYILKNTKKSLFDFLCPRNTEKSAKQISGELRNSKREFLVSKKPEGFLRIPEMHSISKDAKHSCDNKEWEIIELSKIPETSGTLAISESFFKKYNVLYDKFIVATSSIIEINTDFEGYFKERGKKFRKHLKQYIKSLNSEGKLAFEHYEDFNQIEPVLKKIFEQRIKRWEEKGRLSKFTKEEYKNFYIELTKRLLKKGWLDVSLMKLNNKIIASHYGFVYNNRYFYYAPSFDLSYEKYSPGNVLLYHLIERTFNKQIKEFDFGGGIEEYKSRWENKTRSNYQITIFKKTLKARLAHMIKKKEYKLRQTRKDSLLYRTLKGISRLRGKKIEG